MTKNIEQIKFSPADLQAVLIIEKLRGFELEAIPLIKGNLNLRNTRFILKSVEVDKSIGLVDVIQGDIRRCTDVKDTCLIDVSKFTFKRISRTSNAN